MQVNYMIAARDSVLQHENSARPGKWSVEFMNT